MINKTFSSSQKQSHFSVAFMKETENCYTIARSVTKEDILEAAKAILSERFTQGKHFRSSKDAKEFFVAEMHHLTYEVFCVVFLDVGHRILSIEEMFRGTLDCAPVYPREVVKRALDLNAGAVIFVHNHPSARDPAPSSADINITQELIKTLALFNVKVLDHLIVSGIKTLSFAESSLL